MKLKYEIEYTTKLEVGFDDVQESALDNLKETTEDFKKYLESDIILATEEIFNGADNLKVDINFQKFELKGE